MKHKSRFFHLFSKPDSLHSSTLQHKWICYSQTHTFLPLAATHQKHQSNNPQCTAHNRINQQCRETLYQVFTVKQQCKTGNNFPQLRINQWEDWMLAELFLCLIDAANFWQTIFRTFYTMMSGIRTNL